MRVVFESMQMHLFIPAQDLVLFTVRTEMDLNQYPGSYHPRILGILDPNFVVSLIYCNGTERLICSLDVIPVKNLLKGSKTRLDKLRTSAKLPLKTPRPEKLKLSFLFHYYSFSHALSDSGQDQKYQHCYNYCADIMHISSQCFKAYLQEEVLFSLCQLRNWHIEKWSDLPMVTKLWRDASFQFSIPTLSQCCFPFHEQSHAQIISA